jgi:hypothetical protein
VTGYIAIGISKRLIIAFLVVMLAMFVVSWILSSMDGSSSRPTSVKQAPARSSQP